MATAILPQGRAPLRCIVNTPARTVTVDLERGVIHLVREEYWLEVDVSTALFGARTGRTYMPINGVVGGPDVGKADGFVDVKRAIVHVRQNTGARFVEDIDITNVLIECS